MVSSRLQYVLLSCALVVLMSWTGCTYKNHIERGDGLYESGQYERALDEYEAALARRPESEEALARVQDAQGALIEQLSAETLTLLDAQDYDGALAAAFALEERLPNFPAVKQLIRDVSARIQSKAKGAADRSEWARALDLYMITYDAFPEDRAALEPEIDRAKSTWHAELDEGAVSAEELGHAGDALLLHAQAASLLSKPHNVAKRDELLAKLTAENLYPVLLSGKGDAYNYVATQLRNLSGSSQNMRFVGSAREADPAATLSISSDRVKFRTDRSSITRSKEYISGTRMVDNPAYSSRLDDLEREERDLRRREDDVLDDERDVSRYSDQVAREGDTPGTSTGAEQSLSRARSALERSRNDMQRARERVRRAEDNLRDTPQLIEEDVYSILDYDVTTHTRRASLSFNLAMEHMDTEREVLSTSQERSTSASDEEHAGYPIADVRADPLELPPDVSLENELYGMVTEDAFALADKSFQAHRQEILSQAFAHEDLGARFHLYVVYILMDPASVDQRVLDEIYSVRGVPAANELFVSNP